jgi:hypothetical protein
MSFTMGRKGVTRGPTIMITAIMFLPIAKAMKLDLSKRWTTDSRSRRMDREADGRIELVKYLSMRMTSSL